MQKGGIIMSVAHTSRIRIEKHEGPHRTAHVENFAEPIHFGIHGGIKDFYSEKYGREITGQSPLRRSITSLPALGGD